MRCATLAVLALVLAAAEAVPSAAQDSGAAPAPDAAAPPQPASAASPPAAEQPIGADVRQRLHASAGKRASEAEGDAAALAAFYEARKDEPLWVSKTGLTARATAVIAEIGKADNWGLKAREFETPKLAAGDASSTEIARDELASAEMTLSLAVLKYARFARGGRITDPAKQLSSYLDRTPQYRDPKLVLEEIAAASEPEAYLRGLHPKHAQFEKLRQKYLEMMRQTATTKEIVVVPKGAKLIPGERNPQVALLRKRLSVPLADGADETLYDEALAEAVRKFQTESGQKPDAIVGSATRAALNDIDVPSPDRLLANMEGWRWMPEDLGQTYVWVNIPEFMIRVVKDGAVIHEERVITGLLDKQTPVFSDEMELVTFHPRWIVPDSIKVNELYPSLARGGSYFERQGLRLSRNGREIDPYEVDWSTSDIRNFDIYQPPGGGNVLGVVKLSFPNKHAVYMHDTPTKTLFNEASRPFSHGCIRVRNPMRLAELVLKEGNGWDAGEVPDLVRTAPVENPITLDKKLPVHITYFTAWIDDEGNERSFKDVYGHEQRIKLALAGKFNQIARGPDHLAPVRFSPAAYAAGRRGGTAMDEFFSNFFGGF